MARGKVYTTAPLLYNDQGDPIPQYLDVSDKTDSPQGSFKPLTNDPQDVRLTGSIGERISQINTVKNIAPKLQEDILDTNYPTTVDSFLLSVNNEEKDNIRLFIESYRESGTKNLDWRIQRGYPYNDQGLLFINRLTEYEHPFLTISELQPSSVYAIKTKDTVHFPYGVKISLLNNSSNLDVTTLAQVYYRRMT